MKLSLTKIAWIIGIFDLYHFGNDWIILTFVILFAPYSNVINWVRDMEISFRADRIVADELKNTLKDEEVE